MSTLVTNLVQLGLSGGSANVSYDSANTQVEIDSGLALDGTVRAISFIGDGSMLTGTSGGGGGSFNDRINQSIAAPIPLAISPIITLPSTAGRRYILRSVHVTNISGVDTAVTGEILGVTYPSISFGDSIPVPADTSVELLKKPKVLQPNDAVRLGSSVANNLHVTVTLEETLNTNLFGQGVDLIAGNDLQLLYVADANTVIESILLSNDDPDELDVKATVVWLNSSDIVQGYYTFDLIIPNDSTVEILEQPKFIPNGFKIGVYGNQGNRLEAMISGIKV